MNAWLRCKACGFIGRESEIGDVCPACGVPRKMFEPYEQTISESRRRILALHLHPVIVHAPQALTFLLFFLTGLMLAVRGPLEADLSATVRILSLCLPVTVAAALASGVVDARVRFRRLKAPLLKKKIVVGAVLGVGSLALPGIVYLLPSGLPVVRAAILALEAGLLGCSVVLGLIGARLLDARFPG